MADRRYGRTKNLGQCSIDGCSKISKARELCITHYTRWRVTGGTEKRPKPELPWLVCTIDGCSNRARTRYGRRCELHYYRHYRNGTYDTVRKRNRTVGTHGYAGLHDRAHPASSASGMLYEHREVCYNKIGPGSHPCRWCQRFVSWDGKGKDQLVVDHLDNNKLNNSPDNLFPSCQRCNARRGLFVAWVLDHIDDLWLHTLFDQAKQRAAA